MLIRGTVAQRECLRNCFLIKYLIEFHCLGVEMARREEPRQASRPSWITAYTDGSNDGPIL